jgi:hypothetical protein
MRDYGEESVFVDFLLSEGRRKGAREEGSKGGREQGREGGSLHN